MRNHLGDQDAQGARYLSAFGYLERATFAHACPVVYVVRVYVCEFGS